MTDDSYHLLEDSVTKITKLRNRVATKLIRNGNA